MPRLPKLKPIFPCGSSAVRIVPCDSSYLLTFSESAATTRLAWPGERMILAVTEPAGGAIIMKSSTNSSRVWVTVMLLE
jgi:hypothetical protein